MECACVVNVDPEDTVYVLNDKEIIARKKHTCDECGTIITPGDIYRFEKYTFDGKFGIHRTCLDCNSIRTHMCCTFFYGDIRNDVREAIIDNFGEVSEDCLRKLCLGARHWVCEIIEDCWDNE